MRVVEHEDPVAYRAAVEDCLGHDEIRHNVMIGVLGMLISKPGVYTQHRLWSVEAGGRVVGAALVTPPHHLLLAAPRAPGAIDALAGAIAAAGPVLPGVVGALPEADTFAARYLQAVGGKVVSRMDQALHALEAVEGVPRPAGAPRLLGTAEEDLALAWQRAFSEEASPGGHWDEAQARRRLRVRLESGGDEGIWSWEDEGPVCMCGFVAVTRDISRIGPVYTPPAHRRRGYATALVAHVTGELLARGRRRCVLYTDLANPTSNAIYARIGYRRVCPAAMIEFALPGPSNRD